VAKRLQRRRHQAVLPHRQGSMFPVWFVCEYCILTGRRWSLCCRLTTLTTSCCQGWVCDQFSFPRRQEAKVK
jgi:hypothetical protein